MPTLQGSVFAYVLYDVCEEIRLEQLREHPEMAVAPASFKDAPAQQVRMDRPPFIESLPPLKIDGDISLQVQLKYYDYGVLSLIFQQSFKGEWSDLIDISSRWISGSTFEQYARSIAQERLKKISSAIVKPHQDWLAEDYFAFHVHPGDGLPIPQLAQTQGAAIAQIIRGEPVALADAEVKEVLRSSISYYPNDMAVIGWNAALIFDTVSGAETALALLEYANSQLLEFRYYDDLLTRELAGVYSSLENKSGLFDRWRLASAASRLQTVVVEVTELTERVDNSMKFLSDMFAARLYQLAATKVGVPDYKNLVTQKIRTAEELYRFLTDQFHQTRAFVLELMVVIILVIELFYVFRGKG